MVDSGDRRAIHAADPAARRRALIIVLAVAAAGVLGHWAVQDWLAQLRQADPADARPALLRALSLGAWASAIMMAALGAWCWRQGRKVRRLSRFPLPDARPLRDTPVVEGPAARARGLLLQALAGALWALAAGLVSAVHALIARLA
jgi:hypothetical protein